MWIPVTLLYCIMLPHGGEQCRTIEAEPPVPHFKTQMHCVSEGHRAGTQIACRAGDGVSRLEARCMKVQPDTQP